MAKPRMRCQVCRMWINAKASATKVPPHNNPVLGGSCRGSGQPPAQKQGKFDT